MKNYVNHVVFVIDRSGSMSGLKNDTIKVFDDQIQQLAISSKQFDQETRVSVYVFDDRVECLVYDMDCLRLPSLAKLYTIGGNTALIDATLKSIDDLEKTATLYGDHAFLVYVLTDGEENASSKSGTTLIRKLESLPENWTVAVLVPSALGLNSAKRFGFPAQNIQIWSTTSEGIREVGAVLSKSTSNFMRARSTGVRGTKSLFTVDASTIKASAVQSKLDELNAAEYGLFPVRRDAVIKDFVESWTSKPYVVGSAYYMLHKPEAIQANKQICIQNKNNGRVYAGANARKLLALPDYEVKVNPITYGDFNIFVQSTSVNRKLPSGTMVIVRK
jgi:uncharacterized protein YegL